MPDFQQFADRCKDVSRVADITEGAFRPTVQTYTPPTDGPFILAEWPTDTPENRQIEWHDGSVDPFFSFSTQDLRNFATQAERHARLLQQIWEWAQPDPWDRVDKEEARAKVRSLLEERTSFG